MESAFIRGLTRMLEIILIVLGILISLVVFLQVLFRYVLRQPLFWSEELPRYLLIWMSFLASAVAQRNLEHINIGLVVHLLPQGFQRWVGLLTDLAILGFLGILVYSGFVVSKITLHHQSTALQIPMAAVYLALPVGGVLMILYTLLHLIDRFRRSKG